MANFFDNDLETVFEELSQHLTVESWRGSIGPFPGFIDF
jgi:hypothetical protein